jgi:hypothetical protein
MTRFGKPLALTILALPVTALAQDPILPDFSPDNFATSAPNPYVSLELGHSQAMQGRTAEGVVERDVITVIGPGPLIMGVQTVSVKDDAFEDDRLVERTFDYFATDADGNLWYFGEDVMNYRYDDAGKLIGTDAESSWLAGIEGAQPGILVPARPVVGEVRFQEFAPANEATDYARVVATVAVLTVAGQEYRDVLQLFETSMSEAGLREFKYFAKGAGLIRAEEGLSEALDDPEMVLDIVP